MPPERFRWAKVSAAMMDNDKIVKLCDKHGPAAVLFYLASIFYAKSMDSGGQISRRAVGHIPMPLDVSLRDRQAYVRTFLELPLWEEITRELYVIHNWHVYQSPAQGTYSDGGEELSTAQWITSDRVSGSEVTERVISPLLSSPNRFTNPARGTIAPPRDPRTRTDPHEREAVPRCPECGLGQGFHVEDCSLATRPPGLGVSPERGTPTGERCPACGVGWGLGHSADCSYDPRLPLTYSNNRTSLSPGMSNADEARSLRQRMNALRPQHEQATDEDA